VTKNANFQNPRWRTAAILKIVKSPYLSKQEFSYRKQIARQLRTQYVEGISVILKSTLCVTQGHWKRNHCTDHTRLTISELFDVEYYRDLEMWVRGHSKSMKMVPVESLGMVSYSPSIVTMAVSLAISETFNVKE